MTDRPSRSLVPLPVSELPATPARSRALPMPCDPAGVCSPSRATVVCEAFFPTATVNAERQPPSQQAEA